MVYLTIIVNPNQIIKTVEKNTVCTKTKCEFRGPATLKGAGAERGRKSETFIFHTVILNFQPLVKRSQRCG